MSSPVVSEARAATLLLGVAWLHAAAARLRKDREDNHEWQSACDRPACSSLEGSVGSNGRLVQQASASALCHHDSNGLQAGDNAEPVSRTQPAAGLTQAQKTDLYSASLRFLARGLLSGALIQDLMSPLSASRSKQATPRTATTGRPLFQVRPASGDCRCLIVLGSPWRAINSGTGSWLVCSGGLEQPHWPPGHRAYFGCWQQMGADLKSKRLCIHHGNRTARRMGALFRSGNTPTASCLP